MAERIGDAAEVPAVFVLHGDQDAWSRLNSKASIAPRMCSRLTATARFGAILAARIPREEITSAEIRRNVAGDRRELLLRQWKTGKCGAARARTQVGPGCRIRSEEYALDTHLSDSAHDARGGGRRDIRSDDRRDVEPQVLRPRIAAFHGGGHTSITLSAGGSS